MPPELELVLMALYTAVYTVAVGLFIDTVAELFGVDLSEKASTVVAALVGITLAFTQGVFAQIPTNVQPFVATLILLVLGLFFKYATRKALRASRAKNYKVTAFWNK